MPKEQIRRKNDCYYRKTYAPTTGLLNMDAHFMRCEKRYCEAYGN